MVDARGVILFMPVDTRIVHAVHVRPSVVCVLKACSASALCICKVCQVISAWALTLFVPCVSGNAKASGRGTYNCETALFLLTDTT